MRVYYNDNDPFCAAWLKELIVDGVIPGGDVDDRSIKDISPGDLAGYHQVHLFAGIGVWAAAARDAGWPGEWPLWTGSCPCQPFSVAGRQRGTDDPRHLWPDMLKLVSANEPPTIIGEQVASKAGREWLAGIRTDLATLAYDFGGADLCAPGIGAPHIRQRLFWLAYTKRDATQQRRTPEQSCEGAGKAVAGSSIKFGRCGVLGGVGDSDTEGSQGRSKHAGEHAYQRLTWQTSKPRWGTHWHRCADGKARRIEPTIFPLAHARRGSNRMGLLRGAGNSLVKKLAEEFIEATIEVINAREHV